MATKKPVKKPASAKKSAPAKKAEPAKKPAPAKKIEPAKKTEPAKKPADAEKTPVKTLSAPRKPAGKPQPPVVEFVNNSKDLAFSIAEMMKKQNRKDEERARAAEAEEEIRLSRRPTTRTKGKNTLKFSAADLKEFQKRLLELRQEALGQSASLRTNALEQADERGAEDEDGSDSFMRLQNLGQVGERNKVIRQIDEALRRIEEGTYGICEECGQLIRKPRLLHLPFAHTCMECQSAMEKR